MESRDLDKRGTPPTEQCTEPQRNWFGLDVLPDEMIPYAAEALAHYREGTLYSERGWS
ncbi:hypothetical protein OG455_08360 [Kitasatospora sp. NBC_01287]|uniref:hypothetical protein n=1 Tax=Kitasatospora sp. NBC_01287 TaxID=2903573 RepID=UPI00224E00A0|nr:hypothetical protein [Kitasatospora sp. NBC_01287]MCX4745534.1 hypothetical protein [Kitasatospora sp. NBC_01287]